MNKRDREHCDEEWYPEDARTSKSEGHELDDRLKELMQDLGNAINESLSDSDRIAAAIGEIKRAGFDVFLVLEATIGFNKRDENSADDMGEATVDAMASKPDEIRKVKWTSQDQKFLKALKISLEDDSK